jgi:hypothetical protein
MANFKGADNFDRQWYERLAISVLKQAVIDVRDGLKPDKFYPAKHALAVEACSWLQGKDAQLLIEGTDEIVVSVNFSKTFSRVKLWQLKLKEKKFLKQQEREVKQLVYRSLPVIL